MKKPKRSSFDRALESVDKKVHRILRKAFGKRADGIINKHAGVATMYAIDRAHRRQLGKNDAYELGFQMGDWGGDAAKMLALHLFPEKFTPEEIRTLILMVVIHVPNHIAAAAALLDCPISDTWGILKRKKKESRQRLK